jgi:hypothetical protein
MKKFIKSLKIIKEKTTIQTPYNVLVYNIDGVKFPYPCDSQGVINADYKKAAAKSIKKIVTNKKAICEGVKTWFHLTDVNPVGLCECGTEVVLKEFQNVCEKCGTVYNLSGGECHDFTDTTNEYVYPDCEKPNDE